MENSIILIIIILSLSYIAKNTENDGIEGISVFFSIIGTAMLLVHFMAWAMEPSSTRDFIKQRSELICELEESKHQIINDTIIIRVNNFDSISSDLKLMTDIITWNQSLMRYQKSNQKRIWDCYIDDGVMDLNPIK